MRIVFDRLHIAWWLLLVPVVAASWQPSATCQREVDAYCIQDCYPKIHGRGCHGPMVARSTGPAPIEWRCYSPETLVNNATYHSGTCFCSRDSELRDMLTKCGDKPPAPPSPPPPPPPAPSRGVRVFYPGLANISCYRIPAVIKVADGSLLACAEARHGDCSDNHVHEIACRTSADNGSSWSSPVFVAGNSTHRVSNPYPVALKSGKIVMMYKTYWGNTGTGLSRSSDDGRTWAAPQDVTSQFGPAGGAEPGPGAGVQESSGRIVVVSHHGPYVMDYITTSDDDGVTWITRLPGFAHMDEATVADFGDGNLLVNFRHRDENKVGRGIARSSNGGTTWSNVTFDAALYGPVCQGSLAYIGETLYFSNPHSRAGRDHLTIQASSDQGHSWTPRYLVQSGVSAGYSSLVKGYLVNTTTSGILYEAAGASGCIDFQLFPLV